MTEFLSNPLVILFIIIIIAMIIGSIIKGSIRLLIAAIIILVLMTLFTWAPQRINEYLGGEEASSFGEAFSNTTSEIFDWIFGE